MAGQPHTEQPFELVTPKYSYYDYEFERTGTSSRLSEG